MNYGDSALIQSTLEILNLYPSCDLSLRQIDARIAFSVYARKVDSTTYGEQNKESMYALASNTARTTGSQSYLPNDMIEFPNPEGGWIIMAQARVPYYTTSYDAAFQLIEANKVKWSATLEGAVKVKCLRKTFKSKLATPQLSLCAVGLMVQLKLRI